MAYAATTNVSVSKTKGEIDGLLRKYRASGFGVFEEHSRAILVFEMAQRRIVFHLPFAAFTRTERGKVRTTDAATAAWEQACRSRWRALFLCIKAGIETFEESFLAHIQMPDGLRVADHVKPRIAQAYETQTMTPLLPGPKGDA